MGVDLPKSTISMVHKDANGIPYSSSSTFPDHNYPLLDVPPLRTRCSIRSCISRNFVFCPKYTIAAVTLSRKIRKYSKCYTQCHHLWLRNSVILSITTKYLIVQVEKPISESHFCILSFGLYILKNTFRYSILHSVILSLRASSYKRIDSVCVTLPGKIKMLQKTSMEPTISGVENM